MGDFKTIKKHDQGMDRGCFVLCFKICVRGLGFKIRGVLLFFDFSTFLGKVTNLVFRIRLKIISKNSNFKIQYLYVKRSLQNLKITKSTKTITSPIPRSYGRFQKVTKKRDQGMGLKFFVLCLQICIGGVSL